nr:MAG TPA: hypothetical protein [Caudoviricetes sp.]
MYHVQSRTVVRFLFYSVHVHSHTLIGLWENKSPI